MNPSARRARRLLRSSRRGPWGNGRNALSRAMQPVYGLDDDGQPYIRHYELVNDPWYVNRTGWYRPGSYRPQRACLLYGCPGHTLGPKSRQRWLKEIRMYAAWDVGHALSDCCGWGNAEFRGTGPEPYEFVGPVPPRPHYLPYLTEEENKES